VKYTRYRIDKITLLMMDT